MKSHVDGVKVWQAVAEVPKNLEDRDIKEAFEDIGRVTKCDARRPINPKRKALFVGSEAQVERGVAVISFANSSHAKKAGSTSMSTWNNNTE